VGDISITNGSVVRIREDSRLSLNDDSKLTIKSIDQVKDIDPVAVHLKEVNHIDPLSIDALHVSEVKNIDPIEIAKFNVTNLPMVNVSLQKLPTVGIDVKSLPPVSVGTHQNFCVPSTYTLRARVLGIELMRLHLNGQTSIVPKERARREQARSDNKSFPVTSVAGNPAIPSHCEGSSGASRECRPKGQIRGRSAANRTGVSSNTRPGAGGRAGSTMINTALSFGAPRATFQIPDQPPAKHAEQPISEHRVMSGE
jgi:hypothetical protein